MAVLADRVDDLAALADDGADLLAVHDHAHGEDDPAVTASAAHGLRFVEVRHAEGTWVFGGLDEVVVSGLVGSLGVVVLSGGSWWWRFVLEGKAS